jgi:serine protease inhibitor
VKSFEGKFNGKKHPMMRSADMQVKYASLPNGWQAVELPYATPGKTEGTRNASPYRFWAFLPPEKGGVFQEKVWKELVAKADHQMGTIEMPKFTLEKETDLAEWFRKAGLKTAFDPARADFSKITGKKDLYLSKALHKARIQVDELGTKAGAATGMAFSVRGATNPFYLKLDRPFYFTLVHEPTQAVLFAGRFVGAGFPR